MNHRPLVLSVISLLLLVPFAWADNAAQTGKPRRLLIADYSKHILALVNEKNESVWEEKIRDMHDGTWLGNGNILFQRSWTEIIEMTPEKKVVWSYNAAESNGNKGKRVEVHAIQRLANGDTMLAESGAGRIIEVNKEGKLVKEIKLKLDKPDAHRDTRLVRKLENGHYLVAHEGDGMVREYDGEGKVVWEYKVGSAVYSASRLANGNTLIGAGNGSRVVEVDKDGKTVWEIGKNELEGITLTWVTVVKRQANGNTFVVNCHAGQKNPQIFEVTPEKKVVWTFKDFERFGNALPFAEIAE